MLAVALRHTARSNALRQLLGSNRHEVVRRHQVCVFWSLRWLETQSFPNNDVPFRKQLKDEAKRKRLEGNKLDVSSTERNDHAALDRWELTVGLEIHAQLNTERKLFSEASALANNKPNAHVSPFDFALPGSQPAFQKGVLLPAIRAALALGCRIQERSQFDRKHYFYADQPAGYQITQYYHPLATDGTIKLHDHDGIASEDGEMVQIGIQQVQLEQDTAKTVLQPPSEVMLDFNRVSHPLIEIITLPQIHQPRTAAACVRKIQALLQAVNAVTTGMELGGLRADVNVSVRRKSMESPSSANTLDSAPVTLGQRTEIKNLSSIKAVEDAIIAERNRQISVLKDGGTIAGETRGWTLGASDTVKLRGKEGEVDYRYMPDPDLRPLFIGNDLVTTLTESLPQLPDQIIAELVGEHGLTMKDAKTLGELDDGERLDYFDLVCDELAVLLSEVTEPPGTVLERRRNLSVTVANWVLHEMGGLLSARETIFSPDKVPARDLAYIIMMLERNKITGRTAKQLFAKKFDGDERDVEAIVNGENLLLVQLSDEQYQAMARELLDSNSSMVAQIKQGQTGKLGFFVGQMMRKGEGKVVALKAEATLRRLLGI
ncbi:MAG: hypothetical protein Q9207_005872 [Kuettlingeria erythrocarpa]